MSVHPAVFLWIGVAFCMTGPNPQERLGISVGVNVGGKYDVDGDGDLDLFDVAVVFNEWSERWR